MADAAELNQMLSSRSEEVCSYLLPNGKRKGQHWLVGGIHGEAGESMQITLNGAATGRWMDFQNKEDKGATFLWLWAKTRGLQFPEAVKQAKEWLGIKDDYGVRKQTPKTYSKPSSQGVVQAEPNTEAMDYLTVARKIDPAVVAKSKIGETEDGSALVFRYGEKDESGKEVCVHMKFLKLDRGPDDKKETWTTKGTKRPLYGKTMIDDNTSELVICEGEIDALSWHSWSIPAVSIPNGVSDFEWVDVDWEWLNRFERIYISTDMDDPGRTCAQEICKRLGLHRCYIVELPVKDANEALLSGLDRDAMNRCLLTAKCVELDEIKRPDDFRKDVWDHFNTDPAKAGFETPWGPQLPFRVRPAEFTILTGFSGHGKSIALNQLMIKLVQQGLKVMDASMEIKPSMTLYYMARCALGKKYTSKEEVNECISWLNDSMYFLDCIGTVNVPRLLSAMEYARKRHGVDVFVIDSLFKCGLNSEDWGAQRDFADKLTTFCNNTGAHVILVAHSRKVSTGNEFSVPSKSDVSGSSDLTNAAFNVLVVWRNKLKKKKLDEARQKMPPDVETILEWEKQPDGKIVIDKQRFGEGEEAETYVYFERDSCQFSVSPRPATPYFMVKS